MNNSINRSVSKRINNMGVSMHPGLVGLLIDMQYRLTREMYMSDIDDYFDYNISDDTQKDFSAHDKNSIIKSQIEMLRYFAKTNVPIINISYESSRTIKELRTELKKVPLVIQFEKRGFNAFDYGRTSIFESYKDGYLNELLKKMNVKDIFEMGTCASSCVLNTAIGGIRAGFNVSTADTVIVDLAKNLNDSTDKSRCEYINDGIKYFDNHSDFLKSLRSK